LLTPKERIQFLREWKENNKGIQTTGIILPLDTEKMSEWQQTSTVRKPLSQPIEAHTPTRLKNLGGSGLVGLVR
jgi:hypothetical protein